MNKKIIAASLATAMTSGCASIMSGSTGQVAIHSTPSGAEFSVKDENGKSVHHGTTPSTITLDRGNGFFDGQTYELGFSAPGYQTKKESVDTSLNDWYLGNILVGGAIGMLLVDPATGAMWSLPKEVNVSLSPSADDSSGNP